MSVDGSLTNAALEHPLSWRALGRLFVKPSVYFRSVDLHAGVAWFGALWLLGIASTIDRIDQNLLRADLGAARSGWSSLGPAVTGSWVTFWVFAVFAGLIGALFIWFIGGWWYNLRLRWSGATEFDKREGRLVYVFANMAHAIPTLAYTLAATAVYSNYLLAWQADDWWWAFLLIFPFWAVVVSYKGVRAKFQTRATPARIWFLILPMLLYALVLGALGAVSVSSSSDFDEIAALRETDPKAARAQLQERVAARPRDDLAWTILGHTYYDLDDNEQAETAYAKALEINPRRVEALTSMGILRSADRRYDEARGYYDRALAVNPGYAQLHSSIATMALRQGDWARALEPAKRAFDLDSTDGVVAANLAVAYHYNGLIELRDRMTQTAARLGYGNVPVLQEIYRGERTVRVQ